MEDLQQRPPHRTRLTPLTDDELLIFDAIFNGYHKADLLGASVYPEYLNRPYTHTLDDSQLREFLDHSLHQGFVWKRVHKEDEKDVDCFTLSERGGQMWEQERRPDWGKFVYAVQRELGVFAKGYLTVSGVDESICRRFMGARFAAGLMTPIGKIKTRVAWNRRLVPWRPFAKAYVLRIPTADSIHDRPRWTDWEAYHALRSGWQDLSELISIPQEPAFPTGFVRP
jgi:hypothetical protein